jgi:hypothetical protein
MARNLDGLEGLKMGLNLTVYFWNVCKQESPHFGGLFIGILKYFKHIILVNN